MSQKLSAQGKKIYKLGFGQSPFPVPDSVVAALKAHAHEKDYLYVQGLPALRSAIAQFYRHNHSLDTQDSQVIIGPGSKELIHILQMVYPGYLILPSPSWSHIFHKPYSRKKK